MCFFPHNPLNSSVFTSWWFSLCPSTISAWAQTELIQNLTWALEARVPCGSASRPGIEGFKASDLELRPCEVPICENNQVGKPGKLDGETWRNCEIGHARFLKCMAVAIGILPLFNCICAVFLCFCCPLFLPRSLIRHGGRLTARKLWTS